MQDESDQETLSAAEKSCARIKDLGSSWEAPLQNDVLAALKVLESRCDGNELAEQALSRVRLALGMPSDSSTDKELQAAIVATEEAIAVTEEGSLLPGFGDFFALPANCYSGTSQKYSAAAF